jgi:antitoxin PrlF
MPATIESTLTDRYQTTVPKNVREALQLKKRDKIRYDIQPNGTVCVSRVDTREQDDDVLEHFLEFLADDIKKHPEKIQAIQPELVQRVKSLVQDVDLDLDAPLSPEDE